MIADFRNSDTALDYLLLALKDESAHRFVEATLYGSGGREEGSELVPLDELPNALRTLCGTMERLKVAFHIERDFQPIAGLQFHGDASPDDCTLTLVACEPEERPSGSHKQHVLSRIQKMVFMDTVRRGSSVGLF